MTALHIFRYAIVSMLFLNLVACGSSSDSDSSNNDPIIDIDSGLIAYYPFNGNANDESGNSNDATDIFGAVLTADRNNNDNGAYFFDGQDDSIAIPVNIRASVLPQVTMTAWVRADSEDPIRQVLSHDTAAFQRSIGIDFRSGSNGWSAFAGDQGVLGAIPVTIGEWVFLAVVYDQTAGTVRFYVNEQMLSGTGKHGDGFPTMLIGANPPGVEFFFGAIDEVRIYDRALNDDEINAVFTLK